jgi:hypothetical protein
MSKDHDKRLDALEAGQGAQSVTAAELEWARQVDRAYRDCPTREQARDTAADGMKAMMILAKAAGGWDKYVAAALKTPVSEIRAPRWLALEMLADLDRDRPDLGRRVRDGELSVEQANAQMQIDERRGHVSSPLPVEPAPPAWLQEARQVRGHHPGAQTGPSPYTAQQPGAFNPRAERVAQWRRDEEAAELQRQREREERDYRSGGRW